MMAAERSCSRVNGRRLWSATGTHAYTPDAVKARRDVRGKRAW